MIFRAAHLALALSVLVVLPGPGAGAAPRRADGSTGVVAELLPLPDGVAGRRAPKEIDPATSDRCYDIPRSTVDRPDLTDDPTVHVVYLVAADAPDEGLDRDGTLDCSMRAQNRWFDEQSGMRWRLDVFKTKSRERSTGKRVRIEAVDVTFVPSAKTGASLTGASQVREELRSKGFDLDHKRYLTFVAAQQGAGPCGDAFLDSASPFSQGDGQYSQVYLFSSEGCHAHEFGVPGSPSWAEMIAQQEIIHNDGAVPLGAPHHCLPGYFHVCTGPLSLTNLDPERFDVMYPYVAVPLSEKVLDIGRDDYFRHFLPYKDLERSRYLFAP